MGCTRCRRIGSDWVNREFDLGLGRADKAVFKSAYEQMKVALAKEQAVKVTSTSQLQGPGCGLPCLMAA